VNRELADFMLSGNKELLRLWADMQGSWLDAMQAALGGVSTSGPAVEAWQKILEGNTKAFARYAEVVQGTAEKGTDRIKEAVEELADQVKESTGQLAAIAEVVDDDRPATTGRPSRAS
jgi:predicted negative regulator of RcsB-dependent stress response